MDHALVTVLRDSVVFAGDITIEFATSDLTATAITATHYTYCQSLPPHRRGPAHCGDYLQTNGLLTIPTGSNFGAIRIPITDNLCLDRFLKYIQVDSSVAFVSFLKQAYMYVFV